MLRLNVVLDYYLRCDGLESGISMRMGLLTWSEGVRSVHSGIKMMENFNVKTGKQMTVRYPS